MCVCVCGRTCWSPCIVSLLSFADGSVKNVSKTKNLSRSRNWRTRQVAYRSFETRRARDTVSCRERWWFIASTTVIAVGIHLWIRGRKKEQKKKNETKRTKYRNGGQNKTRVLCVCVRARGGRVTSKRRQDEFFLFFFFVKKNNSWPVVWCLSVLVVLVS